ncbi:Vegetative incompatibility protein HET-E-1-like protein 13 [Colletotrichum chrysophilum]|uniref:Vegetative incompatibility protein HET-E-1-like protein 13 n=1 Tax=Colletotrichum chrysophilum TaxID=1836956 RepID=A0AAD9ERV1_9PEZI|nr:Vegetative incompatibility protein HET-E-1-like protein 13 [Colletotrichum chrysophilum]
MSWAAGRTTRYPEDKAYSLLGILDVSIPVIYPDCNAFMMLQQSVVDRNPNDHSIFAWGLGRSPESNTGGLWAESPDDFAECKLESLRDLLTLFYHRSPAPRTISRSPLMSAPMENGDSQWSLKKGSETSGICLSKSLALPQVTAKFVTRIVIDIQDSSAALAKGDFENYQACLFYYGSVLRVKQPHAGVFCIVKDEKPYQESA